MSNTDEMFVVNEISVLYSENDITQIVNSSNASIIQLLNCKLAKNPIKFYSPKNTLTTRIFNLLIQ